MTKIDKEKKIESEIKTEEKRYTKDTITTSKKYNNRKPLLRVLLEDKKMYTIKEVDKLIDDYMKKEVK